MELNNVELKYTFGIGIHDAKMIKSIHRDTGILPPKGVLDKIKSLGELHQKFEELYESFFNEIQRKYGIGIAHEDSRMVRSIYDRSGIMPSTEVLNEIISLGGDKEKFKGLAKYLVCLNN